MRTRYLPVILFFALGAVQAERWINAGTVTPINKDVYADADSAVRNGNLARINIKAMSEGGINEATFDCTKNLMFDPSGQQYNTMKGFTIYGLT